MPHDPDHESSLVPIDTLWTQTHGDGWANADPDATCLPTGAIDESLRAHISAGRSAGGGDGDARGRAAATMVPELVDDSMPTGGTAVPLPEDSGSFSHTTADHGIDFGPMIGEGGLARVYRARQASLDRDVAVKIVRRQANQRQFLFESRLTGALDHPNILPVHDLVTLEDGAPALVMKEVRGASWRQHLDRSHAAGRFDMVAEVRTLLSVCQAVAFAHDRGVLHLDLKPGNVMVGAFGEVLVMDWGCAVLFEEGPRWEDQPDLPRARWIRSPFGTPTYMPPELARGDGAKVGPHSDVYLLGAMLVELLSGQRPRRGVSAAAIVRDAADGIIRGPPEDAPKVLAELISAALQPDVGARMPSVTDFRDQLQHWVDTREARRIVRDARRRLLAAQARIAGVGVVRDRDTEPEEEVFELIGAFQQARMLWRDVPGGAEGETRAREILAYRALGRDDAGLAAAQARQLPSDSPDRADILARSDAIRTRRARAGRIARIQRYALIGGAIALGITATVGFVLVDAARNSAQRAAEQATQSLVQIERLSDHERLRELSGAADALYPAVPSRIEAMESWLAQTRPLLEREASHAAALQRLGPPTAGESLDVRWRRSILGELSRGLAELRDRLVPDVRARLERAQRLRADTVDAHAEAWAAAADSVRKDPRFDGFHLDPQLGLVPLGPHPDSGLQRFAHVLSGAIPVLVDGRIVPTEGDAITLLLIPGGEVMMGAAPGDPTHDDPRAKDIEGPVHSVELAPYFIGQFEITQDQYARIMGANPSAYPSGHQQGAHVVTALHPVEQVRRAEASEAMRRVGLSLPTEAQWERAARADTRTVYWTGDTPESLQGAANLADGYAASHDGPESWRYERALNDGHTIHAPVGSLRANPFGLHDTAGNVWEWCADRFGSYSAETEPLHGARQAGEGAPGVFRGGGFRATTIHARSADRYSLYADDYRAYDVGLRAARQVD